MKRPVHAVAAPHREHKYFSLIRVINSRARVICTLSSFLSFFSLSLSLARALFHVFYPFLFRSSFLLELSRVKRLPFPSFKMISNVCITNECMPNECSEILAYEIGFLINYRDDLLIFRTNRAIAL